VAGLVLLALGLWLIERTISPATGRPMTTRAVGTLTLVVGVVGGIYGIGGGSILSPILVGSGMAVAVVAPAALASTFVTSIIGAATFVVLALFTQGPIAPDWPIAIACGVGGLLGGSLGLCQRFHALIAFGIADAKGRVLLKVLCVVSTQGMLAQHRRGHSEPSLTSPHASPGCTRAHQHDRASTLRGRHPDDSRTPRFSAESEKRHAFLDVGDRRSVRPAGRQPLVTSEAHVGHLSGRVAAPVRGNTVVDVPERSGDTQRGVVVGPRRGDGEPRAELTEGKCQDRSSHLLAQTLPAGRGC
jgi:hypothetical protein